MAKIINGKLIAQAVKDELKIEQHKVLNDSV
jgi:hypothetical protein